MPTKKAPKLSLKALLVAGALGRTSKQQRAAKTTHLAAASSKGKKQQARRDKRG